MIEVPALTQRERKPARPRVFARRTLVSLAAVSVLAAVSTANAEPVSFDVPEQPLGLALRRIADQAGAQVLLPAGITNGLRSRPVHGRLEPADALRRAIGNSQLDVEAIGPNTFVVRLAVALKGDTPPLKEEPRASNVVIVTGRAGVEERSQAETSYSVTHIDEEALRLQAPTSVTEAMKSVPGFWVEASGGEASGNVRARGVPVDGFGSVNLLEDGVPVQHDPALGFLNADQVFRLDETIDRIEVVRGGPSPVFYSNAPAGAINFIPRQVGNEAEGLLKLTLGEDDLYRTDFWYGAPVGDWKFSVGGFYRSETGVRDPGYTGNEGGQIRVTMGRTFDRGSFFVDIKRMDDKVIFYTGAPMYRTADGDLAALPGFDGNHGALAGPETSLLDMKMVDGTVYRYDNTEGTHVRRTQLTSRIDYALEDDWRIETKVRYSDTQTQRNGLFPNTLYAGADFLDQNASLIAGTPGAVALQLRYASMPGDTFTSSQNGNGSVIIAGLRGVTLPVIEFVVDNQARHRFDLGGQNHDVTFGYYFAHIDEAFSRYSSSYLVDVRNHARLLDLVAVNASSGAVATLTDHGAWRYGYEWENASGEQRTHAIYVADEWQVAPSLRIDGGMRWESATASGSVELKATADGGTLSTSSMIFGSGQFARFDSAFSKLAWTLGVNYRLDDRRSLFARYTYANRLPGLGAYVSGGSATPVVQTMDLAEIGYTFAGGAFDVYATGFGTWYHDVGFTNYTFSLDGPVISEPRYGDSETYGVEFEGVARLMPWFDIEAAATIEEPQYKGIAYTDRNNVAQDFDGNQLIRAPKAQVRFGPGLNLMDDRLRLHASIEYAGPRFADMANTVKLPAYTSVNLSARFDVAPGLTLFGYVDNLTNSLGLTEGNPRAGDVANEDPSASAFIARPLLGRNYRLALLLRF